MIWTAYFLPPIVSPAASFLRACDSRYGSGSPKPPSGPVRGLTNPILIVFAASAASSTRMPPRARPASPPESATPAAPAPARLTSSRLVISLIDRPPRLGEPAASAGLRASLDYAFPPVNTAFRLLERRLGVPSEPPPYER